MQRVLCFGGRDYQEGLAVDAVLSHFSKDGPFLIINGGARGADSLCKAWGLARGWPVITMDAPWTALGKAAGHTRNGWMLQYACPDYAIQFPGGRGTADMAAKVREAGVTLWEPYP